MEYFVSRQPIFKIDSSIIGYRLRFQDDIENTLLRMSFSIEENEQSNEIAMSFFEVTAGKLAFIDFGPNAIKSLMPKNLDPNHLVINVDASQSPDQKQLLALLALYDLGYSLCLENLNDELAWKSLYPSVAYMTLHVDVSSSNDFFRIVDCVGMYPNIKLIATSVEDKASHAAAVQVGFSYFEGNFFSKPEILMSRAMSPAATTLAELLYLTSSSNVELLKIVEIVQRDVYLTYKILSYANTVFFRRREEVSTIKQAVITLGLVELKRFISILFTTQLSHGRSKELVRLSLFRGRFCESLIALDLHKSATEQVCAEAFLVGLLSLLEAMFNEPAELALKKLSLSKNIISAILKKEGSVGAYLQLAMVSENGDWQEALTMATTLKISKDDLIKVNSTSLLWANKQMAILHID
jgi:c-di-GMP-related signal transduction protein